MLFSRFLLPAGILASLLSAPLLAAPDGYSLTWSDEFNGSQLDSTKWENRAPGVRRGGYNTPAAVSVSSENSPSTRPGTPHKTATTPV